MEVREFAKKVLFSCDIEEKLFACGDFTDLHPFHGEELPVIPGRPPLLSLERWKSEKKVSFPTHAELLDPTKVGLLLHFFANHELLALELMALALLKFPDAPQPFRLGVVKTMLDEQRHLSSYLTKMNKLGVRLGDVPVNDFFWSQCASMKTPFDYVTRMSLTFEQANLDFASYFRDVLVHIGDSETASLMQTVLDDEIGHVKHGLVWFRRWKPESRTDWQAFCEALGCELNPARAKGSVFRVDSRLRAGLDLDFIQSLRVYSQSKGGLSRISFYNPEAEEEIRLSGGRPVLSEPLQALRSDLTPVLIFVLNQNDVLLTPNELPRDFLISLSSVGFDIPELIVSSIDEMDLHKKVGGRKISDIHPWAVTPWTRNLGKFIQPQQSSNENSRDWFRHLYSKHTASILLRDFLREGPRDDRIVAEELVGEIVSSESDFEHLMAKFISLGLNGQFIAKRPWSASGRHRIIAPISGCLWNDLPFEIRSWFKKSWRKGEIPIVQPLFKRVFDISVQARVDRVADKFEVHVLGQTRVLNLPNGQYAGSCVGRFLSGLDERCARFWYHRPSAELGSVDELLARAARFVGERLYLQGYFGPFGIDAFVYESDDGSLKIFPVIEVNPRYTMGRVALSLAKRMSPGRVGVWVHVARNSLAKHNVDSFEQLRQKWSDLFPLSTQTRSGGTVILSGVLETTPAELATQVWTCFVVTTDLGMVSSLLGFQNLGIATEDETKVGKPGSQL